MRFRLGGAPAPPVDLWALLFDDDDEEDDDEDAADEDFPDCFDVDRFFGGRPKGRLEVSSSFARATAAAATAAAAARHLRSVKFGWCFEVNRSCA